MSVPVSSVSLEQIVEQKKRRRERRIALFIGIAFVLSTLLQAFIAVRREAYGFVQSLLYFTLVHLNVILIMLLVFLVSRNLIKAYLLRKTGKLGSSLRWKMVTSLLAFSILPSLLLFAGSTYVIREGFDRWFSGQVSGALEDAQAITKVHYDGLESNLNFFSKRAVEILTRQGNFPAEGEVAALLNQFPVQSVELYSDLIHPPLKGLVSGLPDWTVPRAAVESLERAFRGEDFDLIRSYGDGDLVQRFVQIRLKTERPGVLVLSQTVPLGLKTRIADLTTAFSGYKKTLQFKESLKANYSLALLTLFVLILFVVSWFGLFIAKSVTEPVAELMKATEAFREGRWTYRIKGAGEGDPAKIQGFGADLEVLKGAFNTMAEEVGRRGRKLEEANGQLISLVRELEDRERYLEILLSSIRRGVVVLDNEGRIQRINAEALELSSLALQDGKPVDEALGEQWRSIFVQFGSDDEARTWLGEAKSLMGRPVERIFEVSVGPRENNSMRSVRATGIALVDDKGQLLGWLMILEDVSDAARLEKLNAWQEVARRVAHEIKNPLTPIQISADRLVRRMGERMSEDAQDGPVFKECLQQIQKQVRVIRDLVREFSQFAKLPEPRFGSVDLLELLGTVIHDYRVNYPSCDFKLTSEVAEGTRFVVRGDAEYLRRLIVNLADNALHSHQEARTLHPEFHIDVGLAKNSNGLVRIVFEDNGPGIPQSLRDKIFDPYVTSKASGLGLGLPIVRRIAIEHSGRIRCENAEGARFVLELPLLQPRNEDTAHGEIAVNRR